MSNHFFRKLDCKHRNPKGIKICPACGYNIGKYGSLDGELCDGQKCNCSYCIIQEKNRQYNEAMSI